MGHDARRPAEPRTSAGRRIESPDDLVERHVAARREGVSGRTHTMLQRKPMSAQSLRFLMPNAMRWEVEWDDAATKVAAEWLVQARVGDLPDVQQQWLGLPGATAKNGAIQVNQAGYLDVDILFVQSDVVVGNQGDMKTWGVRVRGRA